LHINDALKVILRPYLTERTFDLIEKQNKLVFLVAQNAGKRKIRDAIEMLYEVDVDSVRIANTISGKKAFVRLSATSSATDLASKLGLV
jgi:large subunit ribosomal protein L23